MVMPALRGMTAPYVELVNPRGFVIVDKQRYPNSAWMG
jgi:hypothetical protein